MSTRRRDWSRHVAVDPKVLGGKPVIKGTRVAVQIIVGSLAGGMTVPEICEQYRLKPAEVRAALSYAAEVLADERIYAVAT